MMNGTFFVRQKALAALSMVLLAVLVLPGCASKPVTDDQVVAERAQARWDALLAGDLEGAYEYFSPGYRSTVSVIDFAVDLRTRRIGWISAEYLEHNCEGSRCTVKFDLGYRVRRPVPGLDVWNGTDRIEENWIKTKGQWWYLPEK